ncbi:hypothetical protein EJW24_08395 [Klebsiella pneumoniae]|nr:hypothetical protein [Klebsiella pneumoniae]AZQ28495.1 hypothetical protein EJW24_08395 [Klebsiella pneumoniae]HBR2670812.1 hypothetical protein [Klebsiella pneumoniae]HBR4202483.1 hypothetical protein [Klebsiella pneumoniae]HBT4304090.1 hypothetical protein [Klebsiella pneumoniae]
METGKNGGISAASPASSPGRAALTGASNRIPDRNPDKALANSAANVRMTARNVAAVLPMGDKLSLNSPPVALRVPALATGYQTVARIRRYAPLSGEAGKLSAG